MDGESANNENKGRMQFVNDAFNRFNEFIDFMNGFPESYRNELYINEYIMANYGTSEPYELSDANSYLYESKEAQYITYGYHTAGANYARFVLDIAMVLFVANLLEKVLMEGGFASPIGFLRAVVIAFGETVKQINKLTSKDFEYTLDWKPFKINSVNMGMSTFLRFFMLMRSTAGEGYNNAKLRRLQAAVTKNTSVFLDEAPTYIRGNVKGEIRLWFIPGLLDILPDGDGKSIGKVYKIEKEKIYSY